MVKNYFNLTPGHNGPYGEKEDVLRVKAQYILCLRGVVPVEVAHDYLLSLSRWDKISLRESAKDSHNGVIGPAWLILAVKALSLFGPLIHRSEATLILTRLTELYSIESDKIKYNGKVDTTLNHQLWALYSLLGCRNQLRQKLISQYYVIRDNLHFDTDGFLIHRIFKSKIKYVVEIFKDYFLQRGLEKERRVCYHFYNLIVILPIAIHLDDRDFVHAIKLNLQRVLSYPMLRRIVFESKFGIFYNPVLLHISALCEYLKIEDNYRFEAETIYSYALCCCVDNAYDGDNLLTRQFEGDIPFLINLINAEPNATI